MPKKSKLNVKKIHIIYIIFFIFFLFTLRYFISQSKILPKMSKHGIHHDLKYRTKRIHSIYKPSIIRSRLIGLNKNDIVKLTDQWIRAVTESNDPNEIYKLFCKDGNLVGTVSRVKRTGDDIKKYFEYFAKLPNIKVLSKEYNISKVTSQVFINTSIIKWSWDGINNPIVARMTFIFRDGCIFQLHSSEMPDVNESLFKISGLT